MEDVKIVAIVTAGGIGARLPGEVKKQFRLLDGKPILIRALEPFLSRTDISKVVVTLPAADLDTFPETVTTFFPTGVASKLDFCAGGEKRQDSVFNAIQICPPDADFLIIHDGVRPFVQEELLNKLILLAREYGASVPGALVKHTIKSFKDDVIEQTLNRENLLQIYTPQVFNFNLIVKYYFRAMLEEFYTTDDSAIAEHYGHSVHFLIDNSFNLKVTDEFDLFLAEQVIRYNITKAQGN